ncbi:MULTISPECIES: DUF4189 domain-containing protein [Stenotrophomonas]|uniref:DUF4189 domain-containing protein n=1 Tax=Stenotrophomonas lactitubi TaxID=2045214 RepID=A0AAW4GNE3_9GAMM|nr:MULTISPECIES: DUF4189 domain-containing protein [unclassified Stenotrophomonas]MBM9915351.1 DUF4189 domain-containing protein [Stenotrophomonas lactitubi]MBM9923407.1 DUF4189 domain-containing protein [Stenotrophomonas lactitubi]MBM9937259.1 DUF4189 domain-containing protein [Stenotrophomonas lactitubi]
MNTASDRCLRWSSAVLLTAAVLPAMAQNGRQAQMQQHAQNVNNYVQWQQSQQASSYVYTEEDYIADQIARNIAAARNAQLRKDAKRDWWGSLAVNTEDGSWYVHLNDETSDDALTNAMKQCKGVCYPIVTFANTCVAPAYSEHGGMYLGHGASKQEAAAGAGSACAAVGGGDCKSPPEQAFCTGWKYGYKAAERFIQRVSLNVLGKVADPKFQPFPGATEFIAKPLDKRGASTGTAKDGRMVANMAQSWSAIAAGSAPKAYAIHMGLNERDARDTAVSQCRAGDCKVVAAFTLGQCAAVVRARSRGGDSVQTYSGVAKTLPEAEEKAVGACIDADAKACPLVFNNCM